MRAIGSYEEERKRKERTVRNFSIFLLFILVVSSIGYAFISNPSDSASSTGNSDTGVRQLGDRWVFGPAGGEVALSFGPEDTKDVPVNVLMGLEDYVGVPLFLDASDPQVLNELGGALQNYPSRIQEACYGSCTRDLPEKDCSDNMIVWRESENSSVSQNEKCIFIEGDLRAVDAYIYRLFNV